MRLASVITILMHPKHDAPAFCEEFNGFYCFRSAKSRAIVTRELQTVGLDITSCKGVTLW